MGQARASVLSDFITPPRAGELFSAAIGAAATLDLSLVGPQTGHNDPPLNTSANDKPGLVGHFAYFQADGGDCYVIFGESQASVSGGNAPVIATNGTNAAGVCFKIPSGQTLSALIQDKTRWIGFVGSAGQLRIGRSSI